MGFIKNEEKLTKWQQLKIKSKVVQSIDLDFDGEVFPIDVQAVSQATLDAINEKYDDKKTARPRQYIDKVKKYIDFAEDSQEYLDWQKKDKAIESLRVAELALAFLVEKPDGNTTEEQILDLRDTLRPGDFIKIIQGGYSACGFDMGEAIDEAKNS